ncbi:MAG: uracil-DNA glycosylase [Candidatus Nomurabacteria bacterium]|jgi:uracil-DNA glycosylase|nr:uracil-DNA glycosylase [Candidatus Nomurabacteria bacterium]
MHPSWKPILQEEFEKPYFRELSRFLHESYESKQIFPPKAQVFSAFTTDLNNVKVVIIGQDPYHGPNQAHGLAFSVRPNVQTPPSLVNIFKEIAEDVGKSVPNNGNLNRWAEQGVLLLNNTLTVEAHRAGSHRGKGWEQFTENIIRHLNETRPHLVFLLWGRDARTKQPWIDQKKHLVLEAAHPSPLSAYGGFFGCKHFSKTNAQLKEWGYEEISW